MNKLTADHIYEEYVVRMAGEWGFGVDVMMFDDKGLRFKPYTDEETVSNFIGSLACELGRIGYDVDAWRDGDVVVVDDKKLEE